MAFQFRLQPVLIFRESLEDKAQRALGKEQRILEEAILLLEQLRQERLTMVANLENRKKRAMASAMFSIYMNAIQNKEWEIGRQENAIVNQRQVVEGRRKELTARMQDRKVLERLREKDQRAYLAEIQRKEQQVSDEQAVLRYGR